jgi:hypothetical protein
VVALLSLLGGSYAMLLGRGGSDGNQTGVRGADGGAYANRWVAVDEINQPNGGPFSITDLTITTEGDLLTVEMRGQLVDEVEGDRWTQEDCPEGCLLGITYGKYGGNGVEASVETAQGLTHQLAITVKAAAPGSDALLKVVDRVVLGGKTLGSSTYEFVPISLIHPARMMDTGMQKLR